VTSSLRIRHIRYERVSQDPLRDLILGGQDGLVNVLGIVLGISAAGGDSRIILAASLAAAFAEAVSMGAVAYTSTLAGRDHYLKELEQEREEVKAFPDKERQEIREIYRKKGFTGEQLEGIVTTITSDENRWVDIMMKEELRLEPIETKDVVRSSSVVGLAAVFGSFIPIIPFFILRTSQAMWLSILLTAISLFIIGTYEAKTSVGIWYRKGSQMVLIGLGAAVVGFIIGKLFNYN
jgi:predicted membrane protein (TIGR00267 family)